MFILQYPVGGEENFKQKEEFSKVIIHLTRLIYFSDQLYLFLDLIWVDFLIIIITLHSIELY